MQFFFQKNLSPPFYFTFHSYKYIRPKTEPPVIKERNKISKQGTNSKGKVLDSKSKPSISRRVSLFHFRLWVWWIKGFLGGVFSYFLCAILLLTSGLNSRTWP